MKTKDVIKKAAIASVTAGFAMSLSGQTLASHHTTKFTSKTHKNGYMQLAEHDGDHDANNMDKEHYEGDHDPNHDGHHDGDHDTDHMGKGHHKDDHDSNHEGHYDGDHDKPHKDSDGKCGSSGAKKESDGKCGSGTCGS